MLEVVSPLVEVMRLERNGAVLSEAGGFVLTQLAGDEKAFRKVLGKLPAKVGEVVDDRLLRIGPKQLWVLGDVPEGSTGVYVTPLSSSRCRMLLEGANARRVLAACALIDFHPDHFKPGQFVMTGIHHTPVMVHCIGDNAFHIYAMRTFALDVWEWLCDVTTGLEA